MRIDNNISRIRAYRLEKGWSVHRLARETGLNESTIRNLDNPDWSPTIDTVRKLESVIPESWVSRVEGGMSGNHREGSQE